MQECKFEIELDGNKYMMYFNLNVMEVIQEKYGTLSKWGALTDRESGEPNIKALIFGYTEMINEGIDIENETAEVKKTLLTHKQVARLITRVGLEESARKLNEAVKESVLNEEKNE